VFCGIWGIFTLLDRTNTGPTERVAQLVRQLMAKRSIDRSVGYDDVLSECGLSSLDMVNLMLAVETEFDIKIPDRDMTPSNFRSIAQIDKLVGALLRSDQQVG
jgi:acyl carrier protein